MQMDEKNMMSTHPVHLRFQSFQSHCIPKPLVRAIGWVECSALLTDKL